MRCGRIYQSASVCVLRTAFLRLCDTPRASTLAISLVQSLKGRSLCWVPQGRPGSFLLLSIGMHKSWCSRMLSSGKWLKCNLKEQSLKCLQKLRELEMKHSIASSLQGLFLRVMSAQMKVGMWSKGDSCPPPKGIWYKAVSLGLWQSMWLFLELNTRMCYDPVIELQQMLMPRHWQPHPRVLAILFSD